MGNLYLTYREGFPKDLDSTFIENTDGSTISYGELEEESAKYANGLSELGLQPGDRVSVQLNKSPEVVFIYLACLRANLIFHPINTAYKENELSFLLNDAKPSVFICEKEIYKNLSLLDLEESISHIFTLNPADHESIQSIKKEGDHEIVDCSPDHTAALLYSSGTTGQPKGIMLTHGNIGSNAHALKDAWGFSNDDILLHSLPIYHVHGLFVALGCVFLSGSKMLWTKSFDAGQAIELLPRCTVMMGVPTYAETHEERFSLMLLNNLLGGPGMNSRLNLAIREKYGYTYNIESGYQPYSDTGMFHCYLSCEEKYMDRSIFLMEKELKRLKDKKLGRVQLSQAKKQLCGQLIMANESKSSLLVHVGKGILKYGRAKTVEETISQINQLSAEKLLTVANEVFDLDSFSYLRYTPSR